MRDGRHRILCPRIGRNRELSGDCCSSSRDHWFEIAQLSVSTLACLMHCFTSLIIFLTKQDGVQQLQPLKLSPTRPYYDDFNFEELHGWSAPTLDRDWSVLGWPLGCTAVPCLVRSVTGVELTQWNQPAHRPLPSSRSARVPMRAFQRCTAKLIPYSWLLKGCCELGGYTVGGGRLLSAGSLEAGSCRCPFCSSSRRGADRRWGFGASLL